MLPSSVVSFSSRCGTEVLRGLRHYSDKHHNDSTAFQEKQDNKSPDWRTHHYPVRAESTHPAAPIHEATEAQNPGSPGAAQGSLSDGPNCAPPKTVTRRWPHWPGACLTYPGWAGSAIPPRPRRWIRCGAWRCPLSRRRRRDKASKRCRPPRTGHCVRARATGHMQRE